MLIGSLQLQSHGRALCAPKVENIRRFGGSTSPAMPWPEEVHGDEAEAGMAGQVRRGPLGGSLLSDEHVEDKLDRLEKVILRATKTLSLIMFNINLLESVRDAGLVHTDVA